MPLLLVLALLLPMVWAAALLCHRRFEEAAPLVALGLFVLLYALGWAGWLAAGVWLLRGLWLAAVGYLVWALIVKKRFALSQITAGLVLFVVCAAALWWLCRGRRYANWDEFSHWGRALKGVFYENVLPAVASLKDAFREYPPGVAPFQAAVMKAVFIGFREDVAIWLQGVFTLCLVLYPLRRFASLFGAPDDKAPRNPVGAFGAGLLLFLAPALVFWNYYTETTVDGLLGVLFGFVVLVELAGQGGRFERALQCLAMAALPLVKASGILWAVMAWVVVMVCWLAARRRVRKPRPERAPSQTGWKARAVDALHLALPLLCALAAQLSWSAFMALHDVPRRWSAASFSLGALGQLITRGQPAWRAEVVKSYFANLFTDPNYGWPVGFLPYMGFFVLFIAAWALLRRAEKDAPTDFAPAFWAMLGCGAAYVLLMLFSYLFMFTEYEAVRLASLSRYLNTCLAGMALFMLGWVAVLAARRPLRRSWPMLAAAAALWLLCGNPAAVLGGFIHAPKNAVATAAAQNRYTAAAQAIEALPDAENQPWPVYVVAMDDLGATLLRMDYELAPTGWLPDHFSSIGPGYAEDDLMSRRLTANEWAALLQNQGYTWVYLLEINDAFLAEFGPLFEGEAVEGSLYVVVPDENGGVRLLPK